MDNDPYGRERPGMPPPRRTPNWSSWIAAGWLIAVLIGINALMIAGFEQEGVVMSNFPICEEGVVSDNGTGWSVVPGTRTSCIIEGTVAYDNATTFGPKRFLMVLPGVTLNFFLFVFFTFTTFNILTKENLKFWNE